MRTSLIVALGALALSVASASLFAVGFSGDPHEGPLWLAFLALLWPFVLCPLSCIAVVVSLLFERQQLGRRIITLAIAAAAVLLPWLPGIITFKLWLGPERALRDSSPIVRSRGAEALAEQSGARVVALLAPALKDADADVRLNAAVGLWNQGPEASESVPALLDALDDPVYGVRAWAMDELTRIPGTASTTVPRLVHAIATRPEDRSNALEALFWYGAAAAPAASAVCDVLSHGKRSERRRAARALGAMGAEARSCIPELRSQLRDANEGLRETARASLVALGEASDLPQSVVDTWPEREFSPPAWRATPYWTDSQTTNANQRYVFYRDLSRRRLVEGKAAAEIEALLGPPHTKDRWRLTYHLKSSIASRADAGPIESDNAATWWLEIPLDRERRAAAVYLKAE
jgi:HEAT repeat protein